MSTADKLIAAAQRGPQATTARETIEARLGRPIGPLSDMPRDLRRALYLLALEKQRWGRR